MSEDHITITKQEYKNLQGIAEVKLEVTKLAVGFESFKDQITTWQNEHDKDTDEFKQLVKEEIKIIKKEQISLKDEINKTVTKLVVGLSTTISGFVALIASVINHYL